MKQWIIGGGLCLVLAAGLWWRSPDQDAARVHRQVFALGTLIDFTVAPDATLDAAAAHAAINAAEQTLVAFETTWSVHGDGDLATLNASLRDAEATSVPPVLWDDFVRAQALCRSSHGTFDPAIAGLVRLWGFDDEAHFRDTPPAAAEVQERLQRAQASSLCAAQLSDGRLKPGTRGAVYDFGAAAKGRGVARAIATLQAHGVRNAIVNAGGDLQVIGSRGDRPWRVGIRDPEREDRQVPLASLELHDGEAVFTSGDYERYFIFEGRRYHHILDPRSGYPTTQTRSATVLHTDPFLADAASTALFVAGPAGAAEVAATMGVDQYMLIGADGERVVSPALADRLHWLDEPR